MVSDLGKLMKPHPNYIKSNVINLALAGRLCRVKHLLPLVAKGLDKM